MRWNTLAVTAAFMAFGTAAAPDALAQRSNLPDLTIGPGRAVGAPGSNMNYVIRNSGASAVVRPFTVKIQIEGRTVRAERLMQPLKPGSAVSFSTTASGLRGCDVDVRAIVDADEGIKEQNETNNTTVLRHLPPCPDFQAEVLQALRVTQEGNYFLFVSVAITNLGPARTCPVSVHVSRRSYADAGAGVLPAPAEQVQSVPALDPYEKFVFFVWKIPRSGTTASMVVRVDPGGTCEESDESNNTVEWHYPESTTPM